MPLVPEDVRTAWLIVGGVLGVVIGAWITSRLMLKRAEAVTLDAFRKATELHREQHAGCEACEVALDEIFGDVDAELREEIG